MTSCGCSQGACFCRFADSDTTEVTGTGSASDPFIVTPRPVLITDDTATLGLDLQISDDTATLEAQPLAAAHVDVFTADGTWNRPVGVTFARVMMVSGGGGGASGESHSTFDNHGGGGGDAGQVAIFTLVDTEIPASATVVIGQGGAGGAPVTNGNGNPGTDGGDTMFDARLVRGGRGGRILGQAGVHLTPGVPPGQFAVDWDEEWVEAHYYLAPGAGGIGEGTAYSAAAGGYSHPGQGSRFPDDTGGGQAGGLFDPGGDGRDEPVTKMGGGGGGGSQAQGGGNGGLYGGGGGGGGQVESSAFSSGAGGNGADGILVVISW